MTQPLPAAAALGGSGTNSTAENPPHFNAGARLEPDLYEVLQRWPALPEHLRQTILTLIRAASLKGDTER